MYLQRKDCKAFVSYIERSEKCIQIGLILAKKKLTELPAILIGFYKYFQVSVRTHLVHKKVRQTSNYFQKGTVAPYFETVLLYISSQPTSILNCNNNLGAISGKKQADGQCKVACLEKLLSSKPFKLSLYFLSI
jgi:hypothetical protein